LKNKIFILISKYVNNIITSIIKIYEIILLLKLLQCAKLAVKFYMKY